MRVVNRCGKANQFSFRLQNRRRGQRLSACLGSQICRTRNSQRPATIMLATSWRGFKLSIVGWTAMHRLTQAACVRRRSGDRQSDWREHSYQQQNQQQSGGTTMHRLKTLLRRSNDRLVSARQTVYKLRPKQRSPNCQVFVRRTKLFHEHLALPNQVRIKARFMTANIKS